MKLSIVDPIMDNQMADPKLMDYIVLKNRMKNCPVFRFYSVLMYGTPVDNLIPLPDVLRLLGSTDDGDEGTRAFDMAYANQLLTYAPSFIDLIQIIGSLQFAEETFLLCDMRHPNVLYTMDSFMKFIQERYSINIFIIKDIIDIDELKMSDFSSQEGYQNMIADIDRYKMTYFTKEQLESEVIV